MTRRTRRVNELLRQEISCLLTRQVKDPRLGGLVTVTEVDTSPDLRSARVFVSIMGSDDEKRGVLEGLEAAAGYLRRELGTRLTLRRVPELRFQGDDSIERGSRILQLIKELSTEGQGEGGSRGEA